MIKRLYIMPDVWETVTTSQVFNWIKLINENSSISTDCLSVTTNKLPDDKCIAISKDINGNFFQKESRKVVLNELLLAVYLFRYYIKNIKSSQRIIFQTRMSSIGLSFFLLKWLPKTRFIFEARAAVNEEISYVNKRKSIKKILRSKYSRISERIILIVSDRIICVSNSLKEYYLGRLKKLDMNKFVVFPGAADDSLFYYSIDERTRMRKELGFNSEDIVIVYSGKLDKKWEIPEMIFLFYISLRKRNDKFKLLLITPDINIANKLTNKYKLNNYVTFIKTNLNKVGKYLNSADIGLLLREDVVMNNVASPTKFAEYVMTGLPVIISSGVLDFAKLIKETGFGTVVANTDHIQENEFMELQKSLLFNRKTIAEWGYSLLSKEVYKKKYIDFLK